MQLDVTDGLVSLTKKLVAANALFGQIDIVVNNAGVSMMGFGEEGGYVRLTLRLQIALENARILC